MAGILVSPSLDKRVRNRNAAYKKRNESPKFQDILRARCRARIKASRCALIDKFRNLGDCEEEIKTTFGDLLRQEIQTLISNPPRSELEDEDFEEQPASEEEEWLLEEYEKVLSEEEDLLKRWADEVICPLCEMSVLQFPVGVGPLSGPSCERCRLTLPPTSSPAAFREALDTALQAHSAQCHDPSPSHFALLSGPELSGLFLICPTCFLFAQNTKCQSTNFFDAHDPNDGSGRE